MSKWHWLRGRRGRDAELEEEIAIHLRMAAQDRAARGDSAPEAKTQARREFGNVGLVKEVTRDMWGWTSLERLMQDLRYAGRVLRKSPGFAAVAILSMALGIGANSAIFSLIDALLLRALPVQNPQELTIIGNPTRITAVSSGTALADQFSYPFCEQFRIRNSVFSDVYCTGRSEQLNVEAGRGADAASVGRGRARFVTGNFFEVLGVKALAGRTFTEGEVRREGGAPVVVISYGYWERQFARDPRIIGQNIKVNGSSFTVIGVTPKDFFGDVVGAPNDMWFPITMEATANPGRNYLNDRKVSWLLMMGRLKPGISQAQAAAAVNVTAAQIYREIYKGDETPEELRGILREHVPVSHGGKGFSRMRQASSIPLLILMGIVGVILLICCANVANLQLARALNRGREMGLRLAVGASQWRVIRQLLTESVALACLGAMLGLLFAYWGSHMLLRLISPEGPLPLQTELNGSVLGFTAGIAIVAGLLFGLAPALRTTRFDLVTSLKESRSGQQPDSFSRAFGKMLVISQIVLSMILLVFAGLFVGTLKNLRSVDVGYVRKGLLVMEVDPRTAGYKDERANQMSEALMKRLDDIPGVRAVTYSENGLFSGSYSESSPEVEGYTAHSDADKQNSYDRVGPNYFEVTGTRVIAGRGIDSEDTERAQKVAVVNERMARFYFPQSSPIGRHLFDQQGKDRITYTIVGVVGDAKQQAIKDPAPRRFYVSLRQSKETISFIHFEIRTWSPSDGLIPEVRRVVTDFDRNLPVLNIKSADALIDDELSTERLVAQLSSFFGMLALLLGAIGLYGVMAYMTTRRTVEIGIRLALGAKRSAVISMVLSETWRLLLAGLVIGVAASTAIAKVFEKRLFGLSAFDPATTVWAVAVISIAALVAAFLPARRASLVDPLIALRYE